MGGSFSQPDSRTVSVFEEDLKKLNTMVFGMMNADNLYRKEAYNMFLRKRCSAVSLVTKKKLERHSRFNLRTLGDELVMIPHEDDTLDKRELCSRISMYYVRLLRMLYTVKYVYDLEHHGDYGVAGIIMRNIVVKQGIVHVRFCASAQEQPGTFNMGVDFAQMSGFEVFVHELLEPREREVFMQHFKELLNARNIRHLRRWVKRDMLVSASKYSEIYGTNMKRGGGVAESRGSLFVKVAPANPILAWSTCTSPTSLSAKTNRPIMKAVEKMRRRYRESVKEIEGILASIVTPDFELRQMSEGDLLGTERRLKSAIVVLYVESFVNYRTVFDAVSRFAIDRND